MLRCRRIEQEAAELLWQEFGEEFPYVPFPLEYINVQWDPSIPIPDYYEQPITPPSSATSLVSKLTFLFCQSHSLYFVCRTKADEFEHRM